MNILLDIADYLQNEGVGIVGQDIFVNELPDNVEGILIFTTGEGFRQNPMVDGYYRGFFYITVTTKQTTTGEVLADNTYSKLNFQGKELNIWSVSLCRAEALPQSFGKNAGGMIEWLLSFELIFTPV